MSRTRLFIIIWGVANGIMQEVLMAMMDKVLDGSEILRIIKAGLMALRFGLSSVDVDRIELVTDAMEYKALIFADGDAMLYVPKDLLEKLQINLSKI